MLNVCMLNDHIWKNLVLIFNLVLFSYNSGHTRHQSFLCKHLQLAAMMAISWRCIRSYQDWISCCTIIEHTEKSLLNPFKSNRNQIVFTIFRLILYQREVRLVPWFRFNLTRLRKDLSVFRLVSSQQEVVISHTIGTLTH